MGECVRFEVLPMRGIDEQAAALPRPGRLAITCSPVHGPDRAVELVETWESWQKTAKESGDDRRQPSGAAGGVRQHGRAAA